MTSRRPHGATPRQRGQASTEYVVVCAALVLALAVRVPALGHRSVVMVLVDTLRGAMSAFQWALSMPL